ncbi:hypothetical protein [Alkalimonas amylolytica]|uniref:Uncharacterized protein n=1 Tax=Alkalimonas amylolytica TaxID=152573 RepID=A0A1H4FNW8_ALKAM|nr:hypothetical protein [Alkalimonas amylolytica]SEA98994.1 hypothetical protein SAMN04488051_1125 [Alkalimonas amylolytica]
MHWAGAAPKSPARGGLITEQTRGLLGHMLVFARQAVTTVRDLSYSFIRWVFDRTLGALYRAARNAIDYLN